VAVRKLAYYFNVHAAHHSSSTSIMSIVDVVPAFAKLNLPSAEEYQKRKVALISGA